MPLRARHAAVALALALGLAVSAKAAEPDRTILPVSPPDFAGKIGETYKDSTPDWNRRCRSRPRPARPTS